MDSLTKTVSERLTINQKKTKWVNHDGCVSRLVVTRQHISMEIENSDVNDVSHLLPSSADLKKQAGVIHCGLL